MIGVFERDDGGTTRRATSRRGATLTAALKAEGYDLLRAHKFDPVAKHGFIDSQRKGIEVFKRIDPDAPLIIAEAVWQYSHHVLAGLSTHRGPILTVANWSGTWPGLVGMDLVPMVTGGQRFTWDETPWQLEKGYGRQTAPDFQRIPKALGRKKPNLGALALEHAVGRHGRAMHEKCALAQDVTHGTTEIARQPLQTSDDTSARIGRDRWHLDDDAEPVAVGQHEIGEGAADVDADPPRRR